jgi:hypothetical protein
MTFWINSKAKRMADFEKTSVSRGRSSSKHRNAWRGSLVIAAVVTAYAISSATAAVDLNQATKDYLEGAWIIGHAPIDGTCTSSSSFTEQLDFEFRRTGGRIQDIQGDLITHAPITNASRSGDNIEIGFSSGASAPKLRLRVSGPNQAEFSWSDPIGGAENDKQTIIYRCGKPDPSVTGSVPTAMLEILTATRSASVDFYEAPTDVSDAYACRPGWNTKVGYPPNWLRFEVLGPYHYFVMGTVGVKADRRFDLSPIRSIRRIDDKTLRLEILERLPGAHSWDGGTHVRPFTITVVWDGKRIFIPELNGSFVRCRALAEEPAFREPAPLP